MVADFIWPRSGELNLRRFAPAKQVASREVSEVSEASEKQAEGLFFRANERKSE